MIKNLKLVQYMIKIITTLENFDFDVKLILKIISTNKKYLIALPTGNTPI